VRTFRLHGLSAKALCCPSPKRHPGRMTAGF
jgi:hypothetical protein